MQTNEASRLGKSFVCKKCNAMNNIDLATELKINSMRIDSSCPACGEKFEVGLNSFMENQSINLKTKKKGEKEEVVELRESSRIGKSILCNSCGSSFDCDIITDSNLKSMELSAECPNCHSKIALTLDSFFNNRSVFFEEEAGQEEETEEAEPGAYGPAYGGDFKHFKSKKKEDVDYIR